MTDVGGVIRTRGLYGMVACGGGKGGGGGGNMEGLVWAGRVTMLSGLGKDMDTEEDEEEGRERDTGDSRSRVGEGLEENMLLLLLEADKGS